MKGIASQEEIVLPDTLVAALVADAASVSDQIISDSRQLTDLRSDLRSKLSNAQRIFTLVPASRLTKPFYAVDGAHVISVERSLAYSASCAVCVGPTPEQSFYSSCLAVLPQTDTIETYSSALMIMQEVMASVTCLERDPDAICLIDGSRVSAFIRINQFYANAGAAGHLEAWRRDKVGQPGATLRLFESRNWLEPYLMSGRIVGNLKLVSTNSLVQQLAPAWANHYDDKTIASLVLGQKEQLRAMPALSEPLHLSQHYPYSEEAQRTSNLLLDGPGESLTRLFQIYFRTDDAHGVYKIEMNGEFQGADGSNLAELFRWWLDSTEPVDMQEPYLLYVADRFAKEGVSVASTALEDVVHRKIAENSISTPALAWAWDMTQPYRTQL
jgi:hypothetical protein